MFFHRSEFTVRCSYRGLALSVPDHDRLLNSCAVGERRRLQRRLGRLSDKEPAWLVQWGKNAGDIVQPDEVVAKLVRDGVVVELAYVQKGTIAERLVGHGQYAASGKRLALLERRAKETTPAQTTTLLRQYVARQRADAETIAVLQSQLAALQARLTGAPGAGAALDVKFRRLKHEFSKHYHPDTRPDSDAERLLRERVFREFWPIVEEIERS